MMFSLLLISKTIAELSKPLNQKPIQTRRDKVFFLPEYFQERKKLYYQRQIIDWCNLWKSQWCDGGLKWLSYILKTGVLGWMFLLFLLEENTR